VSQSTLEPDPGASGTATDPLLDPDEPRRPPGRRDRVLRRGPGRPSGRRPGRARRIAAEWAVVVVVAVLLAAGLRSFVVQAFFVPSGSMEPTLQVGDRILVDKVAFSPTSLRDGDVVVFARPPGDVAGVCDDPTAADLVKRVVALPGQTIRSVGNAIYVDGRRQAEPYLPPGTVLGKPVPSQRVPPGRFYVMGDNRSLSCDSRYWGTIRGSTIVGRVVAIVWRHGRPYLHVL